MSAFNVAVDHPGVANLVVKKLEVPGHDGVLLSLIYRNDFRKDGQAICYMTDYGAYESSASLCSARAC